MSANTSQEGRELYEFGPFRIDTEKEILFREGQPVPLTHRTFQILLVLVRHCQELVSKDDLMKTVWPDTFVEEANLSRNIFMLRKALGESPQDHRYIVTIPGRGYRLAEHVRSVPGQTLNIAVAGHSKVQMQVVETRRWGWIAVAAVIASLAVAAGAYWLWLPHSSLLTEQDTVVLADFANTTGDPVFDETLRQGMAVQLRQSPYLSLVSDERIQRTLALMEQPSNTRLTPAIAHDICERTASAAVLEGSITKLGSRYVIGIRVVNCHGDNIIDEEQAQAVKKEDVLNALSQITTRFRHQVGESFSTIREHNTPLAEATTSSLEALKAYSTGMKVMGTTSDVTALPLFQRATELDPKFAMAYAWLGRIYGDLGEAELSAQNTSQAYTLRSRTSDAERFWITAEYETQVSENLETAQQTCEAWSQTYPRDPLPHTLLSGVIYPVLGEYPQAVTQAQQTIALDPNFAVSYFLLAFRYQNLGRFQDAGNALDMAARRRLKLPDFLLVRYDLAFLRGDAGAMRQTVVLAKEQPGAEEWISNHESSALAYSGRVQQAQEMVTYSEQLAQQSGHREAAALYQAGEAVWEARFGDTQAAKQHAAEALALSNDRGVEYGAAYALAIAGDMRPSESLTNDLEKRFPQDTSVIFSYLPTLRARLALDQDNPARAIELLEVAAPNELGTPRTAIHANFGAMYPIYERGEAYLAERKGADAAAEFQKILDHRGVVVSDPIGALAHLQLARAYVLAGDKVRAKLAYQDFLNLWKDADPDLPILKQARSEYAELK